MSEAIDALLAVMARLRDPVSGCPWDVRQTPCSLAPFAVEEAYELMDAVCRGDTGAWREELGDVLLQVVFHAEIARERGAFDFDDVARALRGKLIRRHPHVFAGHTARNAGDVRRSWQAIKAREQAQGAAAGQAQAQAVDTATGTGAPDDMFLGLPHGLPPLLEARKIQDIAACKGFDLADARAAFDKLTEELGEFAAVAFSGAGPDDGAGGDGSADDAHDARQREDMHAEIGDLMFALVNTCRLLSIDAEGALKSSTRKFCRRMAHVAGRARAQGKALEQITPEEKEMFWQSAKQAERAGGDIQGGDIQGGNTQERNTGAQNTGAQAVRAGDCPD